LWDCFGWHHWPLLDSSACMHSALQVLCTSLCVCVCMCVCVCRVWGCMRWWFISV
jgi:hypothetical protein